MLAFMFLSPTSSPEYLKIRLNYIFLEFDAVISVQNFFNRWKKKAWKQFLLQLIFPCVSSVLVTGEVNAPIGMPWSTQQNSCVIPVGQDWASLLVCPFEKLYTNQFKSRCVVGSLVFGGFFVFVFGVLFVCLF